MSKVQRPRRSRFMGHDFKILYEPKDSIKIDEDDPNEVAAWGMTDHEDQTIQIDESLSPSRERETLIHELFHQMIETSGIELSDELEESLAKFLGAALGAHIHDNPLFWRYVTRRIKTTDGQD